MIDFNADILSGRALGNVFGDNISKYISELYAGYKVTYFDYFLPDDKKRLAYIVDDTMTIATLEDGTIISIGCNVNYKGGIIKYYKQAKRWGNNRVDLQTAYI